MKNKILKRTYMVMLSVLVLGACGLESPNKTIPLIMCGVSGVWFIWFFIANRERVFV